VSQPNGLWCADYKGEFLLRNQRYCYPLPITDYATTKQLTSLSSVSQAGA
jgi:putative transposase